MCNESALIFFLIVLRVEIVLNVVEFYEILRNVVNVHVCLAHGLRLELQSTDDNLNLFTLLFNNSLTDNDRLLKLSDGHSYCQSHGLDNMSRGHFIFFLNNFVTRGK